MTSKFYSPFITGKYNINMIFINTVIVFVSYFCKVDTCTTLPIVESTFYNSSLGVICKKKQYIAMVTNCPNLL